MEWSKSQQIAKWNNAFCRNIPIVDENLAILLTKPNSSAQMQK